MSGFFPSLESLLAERELAECAEEMLNSSRAAAGLPPKLLSALEPADQYARLIEASTARTFFGVEPRHPQVSYDEPARCERCNWPLAADVKDGCVPGNCSMRPLPPMPEAVDRAYRETFEYSTDRLGLTPEDADKAAALAKRITQERWPMELPCEQERESEAAQRRAERRILAEFMLALAGNPEWTSRNWGPAEHMALPFATKTREVAAALAKEALCQNK